MSDPQESIRSEDEESERTPFDEFVERLTSDADVVIEDVGPKGPLSISQALAIRGWWDRRRRDRRA